jgi:putative transposase
MRQQKCSLDLYVEFLIASQKQYSCSELEKVSRDETMAHDSVNRWLNNSEFSPEDLWSQVEEKININEGYLAFDDTLLEKPYAKKIELTKWQWSGKHHAVKQGIGIVNAQWVDLDGIALPVDYRIYNKEGDDKTKNDHFRDMLDIAEQRGFKPSYVLMDSWYVSKENLKAIQAKGWNFVADIKSNRKISEVKGVWIRVDELELAERQVKKVWLKDFGPILVCKRTLKDGKIRYLITNDLDLDDWDNFIGHAKTRWFIETMHRGLKQVCGLEKSYMRKAQAQKNHIFCAFLALIKLEYFRFKEGTSWYQQKWEIVREAVQLHLSQAIA